jgi:hypothetical protein
MWSILQYEYLWLNNKRKKNDNDSDKRRIMGRKLEGNAPFIKIELLSPFDRNIKFETDTSINFG